MSIRNLRPIVWTASVAAALALLAPPCGARAQDELPETEPDIEALLKPDAVSQAMQSFLSGERKRALAILDAAIQGDSRNRKAILLRAEIQSFLGNHRASLADYDAAVALEPKDLDAVNARGSEHFVLGQIEQAAADFDRFVAARPQDAPAHWKRGIALYYAGRFRDGQRQFEQYQTFAQDDVENAVWKFLCQSRVDGLDAARRDLLSISGDRRVPMNEIYQLFSGDARPDDVLAAAEKAPRDETDLNARRFYAHFYLGLYFESAGDEKRAAKEIIAAARDHKIPHYMWDVARVHARRLIKGRASDAASDKPASDARSPAESQSRGAK